MCNLTEYHGDFVGLLEPAGTSPLTLIKHIDKTNVELRVYANGFKKDRSYVSFSIISTTLNRDDTYDDILNPTTADCKYSVQVALNGIDTEIIMIDKIM